MKAYFLLAVSFFASGFCTVEVVALNFLCYNFQKVSECGFFIATLVTDEYMPHAQLLQKRILHLTQQKCQLEILYVGNQTELFRNRSHTSKKEIQYDNKFAGVDVKNVAIQEILDCMPKQSTLLWFDATVLLLNLIQPDILSIIGSSQVLFAREGKKSINIGVMLIRNVEASKIFFKRVTKYIRQGYWDQGVISCMLHVKTRHDCSRIHEFSKIRWSFLPAQFAEVFKVRNSGICPERRFSRQGAPSIIKLIASDSSKRISCMKLLSESQNLQTVF